MISTGEILVILGAAGLLIGKPQRRATSCTSAHLLRLKSERLNRHYSSLALTGSGPKELPGLARGAGRLTGRAAAFLTRSRAAFLKFSDENEITEVRWRSLLQNNLHLRPITAGSEGSTECRYSHANISCCMQLHKEMQQSLAQLQQIQYELRSGINVLDPG